MTSKIILNKLNSKWTIKDKEKQLIKKEGMLNSIYYMIEEQSLVYIQVEMWTQF